MKIREVKQTVLTELTPFAEEYGFKVSKGGFALSSKERNPLTSIYFTYNTWGFEINLFPWVSIDFKEIHEICSLCGFNLNHSAFINLFVLKAINNNGWNPDLKWKMQVSSEDRFILLDGEEWINRFRETMGNLCELAMNYITKISTIESLDNLYNSLPIQKYNPNCSGLDTHCFIGLISARLSNNPKYPLLRDAYSKIVKCEDFRKETKESFWRTLKYLDNM